MAMEPSGAKAGRRDLDEVIPKIYDELRALAAGFLSGERQAQSLQPTALVHEAYGKLVGQRNLSGADRATFLAAAANVMRRVLIEHARARGAEKRGGGVRPVSLDTGRVEGVAGEESGAGGVDVLRLDAALGRLSALHERAARVVELRFFGGLSVPETATALGVSERLVYDDWAFARAVLHRELSVDAT